MQNHKGIFKNLLILSVTCFLVACTNKPFNNPYPSTDEKSNIYYSSFEEQPKTLDPARAYSVNESVFISQICQPPLQYHYFKRPYTLVPLIATDMPKVIYLDTEGKSLPSTTATKNIAYTVYEVHIKPNVYYQPHPAFARTANGSYVYYPLAEEKLSDVHQLNDFQYTGTRELTADDYVYGIKRLADPRAQSPIFGFLSAYIVGFNEFNSKLEKIYQSNHQNFLDLRQYPLAGATVVDKYTYRITVKGYYQQFIYWLAMPFFSPMPWEAVRFYSQPGMSKKNLTLDWYPVGTGPYLLAENNPNRQMVLTRNPNFHGEYFPDNENCLIKSPRVTRDPLFQRGLTSTNISSFKKEDTTNIPPFEKGTATNISSFEKGGLGGISCALAHQPLPFIDKVVYTLEKETIPRWSKFLQGYYDQSAISSDSFDQAVTLDEKGEPTVTPSLAAKGIYLQTTVGSNNFYWGFNMLDPIVGGNSERARKLRQAIALAIDSEEFIAIFLNGRGIAAQSPLPPNIFGYQSGEAGIDPYLYSWEHNRAIRKNLEIAKQWLAEAGYPDGRDSKTGKALLLNYDIASGGTGDDKAMFDWMREQFAKLGIELQIRATHYNRFQELMRTGQAQIYFWGWNADYPDPENFLFLLYGPNGKVKYGGENASNYTNAEYDRLFEQMRDLPNGAARQAVINKMLAIVWHDQPWVWGFHPKSFLLAQQWVAPIPPNDFTQNGLKYMRIKPLERAQLRQEWNQPVWWPLWAGLLILFLSFVPVLIYYWWKQRK